MVRSVQIRLGTQSANSSRSLGPRLRRTVDSQDHERVGCPIANVVSRRPAVDSKDSRPWMRLRQCGRVGTDTSHSHEMTRRVTSSTGDALHYGIQQTVRTLTNEVVIGRIVPAATVIWRDMGGVPGLLHVASRPSKPLRHGQRSRFDPEWKGTVLIVLLSQPLTDGSQLSLGGYNGKNLRCLIWLSNWRRRILPPGWYRHRGWRLGSLQDQDCHSGDQHDSHQCRCGAGTDSRLLRRSRLRSLRSQRGHQPALPRVTYLQRSPTFRTVPRRSDQRPIAQPQPPLTSRTGKFKTKLPMVNHTSLQTGARPQCREYQQVWEVDLREMEIGRPCRLRCVAQARHEITGPRRKYPA